MHLFAPIAPSPGANVEGWCIRHTGRRCATRPGDHPCIWCTTGSRGDAGGAGFSEKHDGVAPGIQAGPELIAGTAARDREAFTQDVAVVAKERTVMTGVEEQQDQAVDIAVAELRGQAALEGLPIARASFGLDANAPPSTGHDCVPCSEVAVIGERDLGPEAQGAVEACPEAVEQPRVGGVADRFTDRKDPQAEAQTDRRQQACQLMEGHIRSKSAFDSAVLRVGQSDRLPEFAAAQPAIQAGGAELAEHVSDGGSRLGSGEVGRSFSAGHRSSVATPAYATVIGIEAPSGRG